MLLPPSMKHRAHRFALLPLLSVLTLTACDTEDDLAPEDFAFEDLEDLDEPRWATPLSGVETLMTSMNAQAYGQNPGCWDTSPSGNPRTFQQYPCHGRENQRWVFEAMGNSQFRIHSADDDDLCVDVPGGNFTSGQDLQLFTCHNGPAQRWRIFTRPDGVSATIRPAANLGLCMDVENGVVTNQSRIQLFTCKDQTLASSKNQGWRFHDYLDDDSIGSCSGAVRFYQNTPGIVVGRGGVGNFSVWDPDPDTLCSSDFDHEAVNCPDDTDWLVVDRLGGSGVKVRCFDTFF